MRNFNVNEIIKLLKPFSAELEANAAVAILLKPDEQDMDILFVKRAENPRDPWSGQIALPGGKRSIKDRDLKETVFREILEETGINLFDRCSFLGVTAPVRSQLNPEIRVLPFVFLLEHEHTVRLNMDELERYYWIPMGDLIRNERAARFRFGTRPAFIVGDVIIWGLTFRILKGFFQALSRHRAYAHKGGNIS